VSDLSGDQKRNRRFV